MDQVHSSSDLHHLVPVIAAGGAAMTGSVRDPKLHAETQRKVRTMKTSAWFGTILN